MHRRVRYILSMASGLIEEQGFVILFLLVFTLFVLVNAIGLLPLGLPLGW